MLKETDKSDITESLNSAIQFQEGSKSDQKTKRY